jgi:hypothetical protein
MKKILTLLMITGLVWSTQIQAQVSISTTCDDPDASSMLDVQSTDKGMLVPRMTATQMGNIASPATGLLVFNTTANEFYYFDGTNWMPFNTDTTDGDAWDVTGEDQTSAIERTGDVGIGISPSKKLTVYDDSDLQTVFYGYSVVGDVSTIASGSIQIGNKNQFHATIDYNCDDTTCFTIGNTYDDDEAAINFRMRAYGTPVNAMTIKGTGNVGIGTTVPTNALHINKDSDPLRLENLLQQSTDSILVVTGDGVVKYMSGSSVGNDGDAWGVTGEDQTTNIGRTGWVGIGTLSPQEFLHVYDGDIIIDINSGSTESFDDLFFAVDGTICNSIATYKVNKDLNLTTDIPGTVGMGDIVFRTHGYNNPRMIVTYEGNVGIGTTSPAELLDVAGHIWVSSTGNSVFVGKAAGAADDYSDNRNVFIGDSAGYATTSGYLNVAIGDHALINNTTGYGNVAVGDHTLPANNAQLNTAVGSWALHSNTSGVANTALGSGTMVHNTSGERNVAVGHGGMHDNTTGQRNTSTGYNAFYSNTIGSRNVSFGYRSQYNATGSDNSAFGTYSLYSATGNNNIAIGFRAGNNITSGNNNLVIGYDIDAPIDAGSNQMTIGNLIYATNVDGTDKTISTGNVGIGVPAPAEKLDIDGAMHLTPGSTPTSADEGDIYMDATTHRLRYYNGTMWIDL